MRYHQVEVDEEVFRFVKGHAEPLVDTFNSALRRLLPLSRTKVQMSPDSGSDDKKTGSHVGLPALPGHIPVALSQILEVVYLVRHGAYTRSMATVRVAKNRNVAPQTILDKYCRQLNLRADEFDRLLQTDLEALRKRLKSKFSRYSETIDGILA